MDQLQHVVYELLARFVGICEAEGIPYFLVCGSALGAVKYGGFIPWDDDVDVALLRPDYDRFLAAAPRYLPPEIFLQSFETDPGFTHIYAKLRDSRTTFIESSVASRPINHGIGIDVFPLDGYPSDPRAARRLERKKRVLMMKIGCVYSVPRRGMSRLVCALLTLLGCRRRTNRYVRQLDALVRRYPPEGSAIIANHGNWQGRLEYAAAAQLGACTAARFEGLDVRVPAQYDAYLSQKYGDWRAELPPEQRVSHHAVTVCDTERPYTAYLHPEKGGGTREGEVSAQK